MYPNNSATHLIYGLSIRDVKENSKISVHYMLLYYMKQYPVRKSPEEGYDVTEQPPISIKEYLNSYSDWYL